MPNFTFTEAFEPLLPNDAGVWPHYTFVFLKGGRGGGKSRAAISYVTARMLEGPMRWLCGREIQNSIRDSMHLSFRDEIDRHNIGKTGTGEFVVTDTEIRNRNGGLIIFRGLHSNLDSLKSIEGFSGFVIDEAQSVSQASLDKLIPTILRNAGAQCIFIFNPENEDDPVNVMMEARRGRADTLIIEVNLDDNPWATPEMFEERDLAYKMDPDRAAWIWGGKCLKNSDAQIFRRKWRVETFEPKPEWDGPYFGLDFGFSQDPCFAVEVYLGERKVWIRRERRQIGLEVDDYPRFIGDVPGIKDRDIRCDCSRPESISYLQKHGFPKAKPAKKWAGSVEDGIAWLKGHEAIVIHTDCPDMAEEARLYSFKVDRRTEEVLRDIVDKHNHGWDAVRYALEPMISAENSGIEAWLSGKAHL
jgi:phage terminase large subunit